ncbi:sigma-70 family RNA polymerase sigma factor [Nocardia iowensis]|uniref:Sigma-70 family RNA polymerase sigma factor n=1 Tax=Nocardia iowensis TaxID=204891 RepID=A0ABX8RTI5_NOCIO|nr:sigma-70 family RNA polymerase sigma factor [Nocardia iowensis]QXN92307.1 sigma-70 family RNA polymerase sigma factor [Nocardia iowensis]
MVAALLAGLFESHRAHLLSVAYRLTGSVGDAEDAVQESWLRLAGAHQSEIDDLRPWLTTVVSRICLDRLRSAAVRRERYVGQWLPEPVVTSRTPSSRPDPLEAVARKPECRLAAMVVLDTLTPPQRVAFVLHDGLSMSFDEIADILDISADAARELAVEARTAVADTPPPVPDAEHEAAVQCFLTALRSGDLSAVTAALHPDSVVIGDADGTTSTAENILSGADRIARFYLGLVRKYGLDSAEVDPAYNYEFASVNGQLGLVVTADSGRAARVMGFTIRDGLVWGTYDLANPAKLTGIRLG